MRLLLLTDFYPPVVGGIERHVQSLGWELVRRGHEVTVASIGTEAFGDELDRGVRVHRLRTTLGRVPGAYVDASHPFSPPAPDPELTVQLARLARHVRPDVVHAHGWTVYSWLAVAAALRKPLVITLHDYGLVCAKRNLLYLETTQCSGPALAKCLRCASEHYGTLRGLPMTLAVFAAAPFARRAAARFIAVSHAVALGNELQDRPHEVIPNFLPEESAPDEPGLAQWVTALPDEPFLLFVGALGSHKGLPVLFEAYRALVAPPPLVCIGHRGADTPAVLPPGVRILEDWPHDAVRVAWRRSLVGLIPSTWAEPFGIVALEALAAGVPVVASRIGGLSEVIEDEVTGLLVPPRDPAALAAAIARLVGDPALRARMGEAGQRAATAYAADKVVPRVEAVYRAVLDEASIASSGRKAVGR